MSQENINPISIDPTKGRNPTKFSGALGAAIDASQQDSAEIDNAWQRSILGDSFVGEQDALRQSTMIANLLRAYMRIAQGEQITEMKAALAAEKDLKEVAIG